MILLIDNYDSFTYNVKQEIEVLGFECIVKRNDEITVAEIESMRPEKIVISPGPGRPEDAGITLDVIKHFAGRIPVFGICLGHQAMGHYHGGNIIRGKRPMHGKVSKLTHEGKGVFQGLESNLDIARYHSLVIEKDTLPASLEITALSDDGEIMGVRNVKMKQEGVQFHPESIATASGRAMIANFLNRSDS
jgi:anthranilate synthase/aminodeoxychorismate synthase-like glutamine amidotransferase